MSIYKSSSLAMLPTAYKDGKLYSVRPTDGSGDFTFSRGSNLAATRVASSGYIEKGRENLLVQSNQFDTTWLQTNTTLTSSQSGYNGNNAWKVASASGGQTGMQQNISFSNIHTFSIYAKAGSVDFIKLFVVQSGTNRNCVIDLSDGSVASEVKANSSPETSVTSLGNGWYRIEMPTNANSATFVRIRPHLAISDENLSVGDFIFIQDAQLEQSLVATDYIETGASTAQSGILEDLPRLDYSGGASCPSLLLEPQRSNLVPFSEHLESSDWGKTRCTIEDNSTTSPEGVINASKMTSTDASESYIQDNLTTTGTKITWSFFAKKGDLDYAHGLVWDLSANGCRQWFNLSTGAVGGTTTFGSGYSVDSATIEDYGNGWYRCAMVVNSTAGAQGCRVNISSADTTIGSAVNSYGYFYGLQGEDASYPTSYIPTYGSAVTRSQDSCVSSSLTASTDFTIFFEAKDFCLINGGTTTGYADIQFVFGAAQSPYDAGGSYHIYANSLYYYNGSATTNFGVIFNNQTDSKFALVKRGNKGVIFANGVKKTEITLPSGADAKVINWDTINLTQSLQDAQGDVFGSNYKQLLKFDTALTDSECIALTTI